MSQQLLRFVEKGNPSGKTLVFLHGWPDSAAVYKNQVALLESKYRIILCELPGYETDGKPLTNVGMGISVGQCAERFAATVAEVMKGRDAKVEQGTTAPAVICHDWGAAVATTALYNHHHDQNNKSSASSPLFSRVAILDIGPDLDPSSLTAVAKLMIVAYQAAAIFCFVLGKIPVVQYLAQLLHYGLTMLLGAPSPTSNTEAAHLYYATWFGERPKSMNSVWRRKKHQDAPYGEYLDVPTSFWFAKNKPFFFHDARFEKFLSEQGVKDNQSAAVAVETGDHWFFARKPEGRHVQKFNEELLEFLAKN